MKFYDQICDSLPAIDRSVHGYIAWFSEVLMVKILVPRFSCMIEHIRAENVGLKFYLVRMWYIIFQLMCSNITPHFRLDTDFEVEPESDAPKPTRLQSLVQRIASVVYATQTLHIECGYQWIY